MSQKSSAVPKIQSKNPTARQQAIVPVGKGLKPSSMRSCHTLPSVTKKPHSRVPLPQVERIKQRYILGQSERQIAQEEGRSRPTIARIVRGEDMQQFISEMRAQFYGLAFDALKSIRFALQNNLDPRLAYKVLVDAGIVLSPEERAQVAMQQSAQDGGLLTPLQRTMVDLVRIAEEKSEVYGTSLPSPEEVKHNWKISQEIDAMTGGNSLQLSSSNPAEWNRLKGLVEERLKKNGKGD